MSALAGKAVSKLIKHRMSQYAPIDPYYEYVVDERTGKEVKTKRKVPDGLSRRDANILKKIRKRAHYLDKGMSICGFRVGWTFFIGIIPGAGDVVDAALNYFLVLRPSKKLDIPSELSGKMWMNNAISAGLGVIPIVGDIGLAAWRANSRNALLLETYLAIRAQEYLAHLGQAPSQITQPVEGVSIADLRRLFAPGSGFETPTPGVGETGITAPALPARQGSPVKAGKAGRAK